MSSWLSVLSRYPVYPDRYPSVWYSPSAGVGHLALDQEVNRHSSIHTVTRNPDGANRQGFIGMNSLEGMVPR